MCCASFFWVIVALVHSAIRCGQDGAHFEVHGRQVRRELLLVLHTRLEDSNAKEIGSLELTELLDWMCMTTPSWIQIYPRDNIHPRY